MKKNMNKIAKEAKKLVSIAKEKGLIKPHTTAFRDFPVQKEIHKGEKEYYE